MKERHQISKNDFRGTFVFSPRDPFVGFSSEPDFGQEVPATQLAEAGWILSASWGCRVEWLSSHVMLLGQDTLVPTQKLEDPEAWQIEAWHLLPACEVFLVLEDPGFLAAVENRSPSRIRKHLN